MGMAPAAGMPPKRKTSIVVWILLAIGGLFILGIAGVALTTYYFVRNPGKAMARMITAANPNIEVLDSDSGSQSFRVRDRKTGEEFTLSYDDIKQGKFKIKGHGENGEVGEVEFGGDAKVPSWVPMYPGAKAQANITAKGTDGNGAGEGGVVTLTTSDSPAQVFEFYQNKCKDAGMKLNVTQVSDSGGMIVAVDDANERTVQVVVASGSPTTVSLTYGRKR